MNMGYVVGPPVAAGDGTLVIRYKNGDVCNVHSELKHYRSTTIMFHCSLQQVHFCSLVVNCLCYLRKCPLGYQFLSVLT